MNPKIIYCTECGKKWNVSPHVMERWYICPHCAKKDHCPCGGEDKYKNENISSEKGAATPIKRRSK